MLTFGRQIEFIPTHQSDYKPYAESETFANRGTAMLMAKAR
jgi:hypothetical protein